jgi:twinkle protein
MLYIITGIPTHGKSSFLNWMEAMLAAKNGWKFAIFSPEHYPLEYLIYRYAEILTGKGFFHNSYDRMTKSECEIALEFINKHFYFIRPTEGMYTMKELLNISRSLVLRHGVKGFTIDPWNTIKHDYTTGMTETQYIETSLNELTLFKQAHDVAVFLVAHPRKMSKIKDTSHPMFGLHEVPTLYDISGSKSFYDKADVGLTVYRNFKTESTTVYVQKIKFKHLGEVGMTDFKYIGNNSRYNPIDENNNLVRSQDSTMEMIKIEPEQTVLAQDWYNQSEDVPPF